MLEKNICQQMCAYSTTRLQATDQHEFEVNCILIEKEYQRLNKIAQYSNKVEPMKYVSYFLIGLISAVLSMTFLIHLFEAGVLSYEKKQYGQFMNNWFEGLYYSQNWGFLSIVFFIFTGFYLFLATLHGNVKFGLRIFSFTFYPLIPQETFLSAFLVNAILLNVVMCALTYLIVDLFRQFMRGTQAAIFFQVIAKNTEFYRWAF